MASHATSSQASTLPMPDPHAMAHIDNHALNTPAWAEGSIQSLAQYLIRPARNEYEKTRAIYRWITDRVAYDTRGYFAGSYGDLSPDGVLRSRTAVCAGYAGLFEALGQAAGLEVVQISGYSKGYSYAIGSTFNSTNHAWNAVKINRRWRLLDSTWGAGYLDERGQFVRRFSGHYFLTPPEHFIYDHLPAESHWQLLRSPISKREYEQLVRLKPAFFLCGLQIDSHPKGVIQAGNQVVVTLRAPLEALLIARLEQGGRKLDQSLTFVQKESGKYTICAVFPTAGQYVLRLYAKQNHEPGSYDWALDYQVEARTGMGRASGFPLTYKGFDEHGVYLHQPLMGRLKAGRAQEFKLTVPNAIDVAVVAGANWLHLQRRGQRFEGKLNPVPRGKVGVYAKFPGQSSFSGLLEYAGV